MIGLHKREQFRRPKEPGQDRCALDRGGFLLPGGVCRSRRELPGALGVSERRERQQAARGEWLQDRRALYYAPSNYIHSA